MSLILLAALRKVSKGAKIRNQYNQVPHLTQDKKPNKGLISRVNYLLADNSHFDIKLYFPANCGKILQKIAVWVKYLDRANVM